VEVSEFRFYILLKTFILSYNLPSSAVWPIFHFSCKPGAASVLSHDVTLSRCVVYSPDAVRLARSTTN